MMELLSNNSVSAQMASATGNNTPSNGKKSNTNDRLLAGIMDGFPAWNGGSGMMNKELPPATE